jgi:hypothetical protein
VALWASQKLHKCFGCGISMITLGEETENDVIIEGEARQVKEEGKSIEAIKKGK